MFQSLKRDHSSSDIAMFQGNVYVCTLKFQSLKRDHSSSDLLWKDSLASSSKVSIAQARPFLFRPDLPMRGNFPHSRFNRSSATIPLPTRARWGARCACAPPGFQSLKRDHSSSDRSTGKRWMTEMHGFNRSSATIPLPTPSNAGASASHGAFQSLKRDHSSSDLQEVGRTPDRAEGFNRSSATIPLPTWIEYGPGCKLAGFNRSSATIPLPTSRKSG